MTLIELLIVAAVIALIACLAMPSLARQHQRHALLSAAGELESDLQLARTLALTRGQTIRFSLKSLDTAGVCYVIYTGTANACTCDAQGRSECSTAARAYRSTFVAAETGLGLSVNGNSQSLAFSAAKGTVTPTATFTLTNRYGVQLQQIVNVAGRVRSCSSDPTLATSRCART